MIATQPPPFDEAAQLRAMQVAVACGKPNARVEGLAVIHAVLASVHFEKQKDVVNAYQVSAPRFREWQKLIAANQEAVQRLTQQTVPLATTLQRRRATVHPSRLGFW